MIYTIVHIPLLTMDILDSEPSWITQLQWAAPDLFVFFVFITVILSFAMFIRSLYKRFAALNALLRSHLYCILAIPFAAYLRKLSIRLIDRYFQYSRAINRHCLLGSRCG